MEANYWQFVAEIEVKKEAREAAVLHLIIRERLTWRMVLKYEMDLERQAKAHRPCVLSMKLLEDEHEMPGYGRLEVLGRALQAIEERWNGHERFSDLLKIDGEIKPVTFSVAHRP